MAFVGVFSLVTMVQFGPVEAMQFGVPVRGPPAPRMPKGFCAEDVTFWLHFPKAGSTFCQSVLTCKPVPSVDSIVGGWGTAHLPLTSEVPSKFVDAMFRKPDQRLASAFADASQTPISLLEWGLRGKDDEYEDVIQRLRQGKTPANDEHLGKDYLGCQTNMILGRECMSGTPNPTHLQTDVKRAIASVDQFRFAGLQEEWALSICLFNYIISGRRFLTKEQIEVGHATQGNSGTLYDTTGYPRDVADEILYQHVVKKFHLDVSKHGITMEACSVGPTGEPIDVDQVLASSIVTDSDELKVWVCGM